MEKIEKKRSKSNDLPKQTKPQKKVLKIIAPKDITSDFQSIVKMKNQTQLIESDEFFRKTIEFYEGLLQVYSSKDHLIVGRDKEEE